MTKHTVSLIDFTKLSPQEKERLKQNLRNHKAALEARLKEVNEALEETEKPR
jgi:hypothetical protein